MKEKLNGSFEAFCRKMKRQSSAADDALLAELLGLSVFPVENALFLFDCPYNWFTAYLTAPADILHTLLSGLFRDWIVVYVVIIGNYIMLHVITEYSK